MKMIELQCVHCGAKLKIEEDRKECFCSYCGARIDTTNPSCITSKSADQNEDNSDPVRLKELELEREKMSLKSTIIKVWIFCVVVLAVVAIQILLKDKDNPNSLGYLLLLIDFNVAVWPAIFFHKNKK